MAHPPQPDDDEAPAWVLTPGRLEQAFSPAPEPEPKPEPRPPRQPSQTPAAIRKRQSRELAAEGRGLLRLITDLEGAACWLNSKGFRCDSADRASMDRALAQYVHKQITYDN